MIKYAGINRCEGTGIIERIEGNGWDIDDECIEMNGVNAKIIDGPENRIISLNGPAVNDLFKSLSDLLKENGKLRQDIKEQSELIEKCDLLEHDLKLANKWNPIKDFIREITGDDIDFAVKTFLRLIPGYYVTVSVSRQEDDDNG